VTLPCCFAVAPPLPVCFRRRLVWVCVSIEQSCSCLHADRLSRADGLELDAPGYILNRAALAHCLITSIACEVPDRRAEDRLTGRRERALDVIAAVSQRACCCVPSPASSRRSSCTLRTCRCAHYSVPHHEHEPRPPAACATAQ